jgi:predicted branched-subunit amino acid permease
MPPPPPPTDSPKRSATAVFFAGFRAAWRSVLACVVIGTYVGIGALTHDFGFGLGWAVASTALVWAGPAQVILVSALGAGAAPVETALAVGVSSARLLPMVISLLPSIRRPQTPYRALVLPAHFTAVTMWIEALRLLPQLPREARIPFANGVGFGFMTAAQAGTLIGYYLATSLPPLLTAGLLFLTPVSFLISTTRNCRLMSDWLALAFGLVLGPLMAAWQVGLDLLWSGIVAGSLAYGIHRLREALK